jgi:hypothetical protein
VKAPLCANTVRDLKTSICAWISWEEPESVLDIVVTLNYFPRNYLNACLRAHINLRFVATVEIPPNTCHATKRRITSARVGSSKTPHPSHSHVLNHVR